MYVSGTELVNSPYGGPNMLRIGQPINLFPNNIYRNQTMSVFTPKGIARIHGKPNQIINFLDLMKQHSKLNKHTDEDVYTPLELYGNDINTLSDVQTTIAANSGKYIIAGLTIFAKVNGVPSVILFRSSGRYTEPNGDYTGSQTNLDVNLKDLAGKKANEDTANLFNISTGSIPNSNYIDYNPVVKNRTINDIYRCYYIGIGDINTSVYDIVNIYKNNLNKIRTNGGLNTDYLQTDDIIMIPINDIVNIRRPDVRINTTNLIRKIALGRNYDDLCRGTIGSGPSTDSSGTFKTGTTTFNI